MTTEERLQALEQFRNSFDASYLGSLKYPPDPESQKSIEFSFDRFAVSKIMDLIWRKLFYYFTFFESADGYLVDSGTGGGSAGVSDTGLSITTGATSGNDEFVAKRPSVAVGSGTGNSILSWARNQRFRTDFAVDSVTSITAYLVRGATQNRTTDPYFGFKVVNNALQGVCRDNSTEGEVTIALATITAATKYAVEARFLPGDKIVFSILNATTGLYEEKGVLSTKLPRSTTTINDTLMEYYLKTTAAGAKNLTISFFEYQQER